MSSDEPKSHAAPTQDEASMQSAPAAPAMRLPSDNGWNMYCQWDECDDGFGTAEDLYDHLCEKHVGRKSTNNLNLTCHWGSCSITTVKRDHITSHLRVHVPLKPHKCEFCGKAFKRPQDLKKHVKTHADDSVLLRSPDGSANDQQKQQNQFPADNKAYFPGHELANSAYPPPPGGQLGGSNSSFYPTPQQYNGYGQVNYPGTNLADQQSMDTRRRAIEALNDFLGDVKRRALDPSAYYDLGQRLNTQSLPLPVSIGAGYSIGNSGYNGNNGGNGQSFNSGSNALFDTFGGSSGGIMHSGGNGGGVQGPLAQNYSLPLSNARSKGDLMDIDRFLEQLSATVYESSGQAAAAGVQHPGVHAQLPSGYAGYNNYHRSSHSPPEAQQVGASSAGAVRPLSSVAQMANMTASANGMDTPALTPASVSSYASSGHSPISSHSRSSGDGSSMYPQLPSVTHMSEMGSSYSSAPPSGLTSTFDNFEPRRYSGGRLQREAPPRSSAATADDAMDIDSEDGQRTPRKGSVVAKDRPASSSNVDPALRSGDAAAAAASPSEASTADADDKAQEAWVENVRVIEQLRKWVQARLESGDFVRDSREATPEAGGAAALKSVEGVGRAGSVDMSEGDEERLKDALKSEVEDGAIAYPTLKSEA